MEMEMEMEKEIKTCFVTLCDASYFLKAKQTIHDLRIRGKWNGDIVLIPVDFSPFEKEKEKEKEDFMNQYRVQCVSLPKIDTSIVTSQIIKPFSEGDGREWTKVNQWQKLNVFHSFFRCWKRVVFLDAGLRILDSVEHLLCLDYQGSILVPNDGFQGKPFSQQISYNNPVVVKKLIQDFFQGNGEKMKEKYFLNYLWIYDTNILSLCSLDILVNAMNKYPCCKTNEMGIMNLIFHFQYRLWKEFPEKNANGKYLFEWCELNRPGTVWSDYCYLKYPVTIAFDFSE
jgi:hypothetical protein